MNKEALFSTGRDDWETPPELFAELDAEFHFDLDPCAADKTAKCKKYFTPEDDGLLQPWVTDRIKSVFCNPPYSRRSREQPGQEDWIKKAYEEGQKPGAVIVLLLPARTDTRAFHTYISGQAEVRFIKGRVKFLVNGKRLASAPFPNMIVIFRGAAR